MTDKNETVIALFDHPGYSGGSSCTRGVFQTILKIHIDNYIGRRYTRVTIYRMTI